MLLDAPLGAPTASARRVLPMRWMKPGGQRDRRAPCRPRTPRSPDSSMIACTSRAPSTRSSTARCSAFRLRVALDEPCARSARRRCRSVGIFFSIRLHSSTRRAPSSSSDSGLIDTTKSCCVGATSASKLNVPCFQVNRKYTASSICTWIASCSCSRDSAPCSTSSSPRRLSRRRSCARSPASSCACVIDAGLHEHVAEPVAPVHDRRVADAALVEVDVAEVVPVRDAQAAGLLAHGEQLQHVGEARLFETSANGHQRSSSMRRAAASGHSQTIFSPSRKNVSAAALHRRRARRFALDPARARARMNPIVTGTRRHLGRRHDAIHGADDLANARHRALGEIREHLARRLDRRGR